MVLLAAPLLLTSEEQGRLLASVYAYYLEVESTGMHKELGSLRTTRPVKTCQPQWIGITHVLDAQELFSQEARE